MIKTSALEPRMSPVAKSLKCNAGFNKNSCITAQNGTSSIMLNLSTLRPYEVVLGIFFMQSLHTALNMMTNCFCSCVFAECLLQESLSNDVLKIIKFLHCLLL